MTRCNVGRFDHNEYYNLLDSITPHCYAGSLYLAARQNKCACIAIGFLSCFVTAIVVWVLEASYSAIVHPREATTPLLPMRGVIMEEF